MTSKTTCILFGLFIFTYMPPNTHISIPTPIGAFSLSFDQVSSYCRDELGGVRITLKEQIADINPEIICGYPYDAFKDWYESNAASAKTVSSGGGI